MKNCSSAFPTSPAAMWRSLLAGWLAFNVTYVLARLIGAEMTSATLVAATVCTALLVIDPAMVIPRPVRWTTPGYSRALGVALLRAVCIAILANGLYSLLFLDRFSREGLHVLAAVPAAVWLFSEYSDSSFWSNRAKPTPPSKDGSHD